MKPIEESFVEALEYTAQLTPQAFPKLTQHIDPTWVEEALLATGTATVRRRRMPAEQTVWLLLGMALLRDLPITLVARQLDVALPALDGSRTVASSALTQARARLGPEPMEWLFLRSAEEWADRSADADRWRGLALYGVDGTTLRVADSSENRAHFGGQDSGRHEGGRDERHSGYPLMRLVVLMALRSHVLGAAVFGPFATDERTYAASLWETVPENSLVLVDRHHLNAGVLVPLTTTGTRHWMTRAKSSTKFTSIRRLGVGDELVEFKVSSEARKKNTSLPTHFDARAIKYQRKGYRPQLLLTSLVDDSKYPASEIRALYHERWELELGFGEIKTDMLERLETIRSKSPSAVAQEMWGLLIAYNLVRLEMARIAAELGVPPIRISFVAALREFAHQWSLAANGLSPGTIPKHLATLPDRLRHFVIPPRRGERVYPRAVKIKMSNYDRKVPSTISSRKRTK
ncbi:MAG TPA: IS4 family transposase [Kofleriaceae bacterium]